MRINSKDFKRKIYYYGIFHELWYYATIAKCPCFYIQGCSERGKFHTYSRIFYWKPERYISFVIETADYAFYERELKFFKMFIQDLNANQLVYYLQWCYEENMLAIHRDHHDEFTKFVMSIWNENHSKSNTIKTHKE